MAYNPQKLGDLAQIWKCFLLGGLITAALIYFAVTENVVVFIVTLGIMIAAAVLFMKTVVTFGKPVYLFQNLVSLGAGALAALVINVTGYLLVYFAVVFILVLITWLHRYTLKKLKAKTEAKTEDQEEPKTET
jgi:hypothetical protein